MKGLMAAVLAVNLVLLPAAARAEEPIAVVTAENFYGDVAQQIGGPAVRVASILSNPNQDPHAFEASASTARALADARVVVYSGAGYDPWVDKLLSASGSSTRRVIVVADLLGRKPGDNPHLWYEPQTMPALARALAREFEAEDPAGRPGYEDRLQAFLVSLQKLDRQIETLHRKYAGLPVTATEPIFGYMVQALGLVMRNGAFQIAVMNETEPSASEIAAFEDDLRGRKVKLLLYNDQVTDDLTARLRKLAKESGVAVVGVSETEPPGTDYQDWMAGQLEALDRALSGAGS